MKRINAKGIEVIVYEPSLEEETYYDYQVVNDLAQFKVNCDIILANRPSDQIKDVEQKTYTRDLFGRD